jgi:hypothetical protein
MKNIIVKKYLKYIFIISIALFSFACGPESLEEMEQRLFGDDPNATHDNKSEFDHLLIDGVTIQLEQIYLMPHKQTIPYLDKPVDSLFKNGRTLVNLNSYTVKSNPFYFVMNALQKHEKWRFYNTTNPVTHYVEHGFATTYFLTTYVDRNEKEFIVSNNQFNNRMFVFQPRWGFAYRGHDNYSWEIQQLMEDESFEETNLVLTVLTWESYGNALQYKPFLYFDTNDIVQLGYYVEQPLTGSQVKYIVESGTGFEIVAYRGLSLIKIGNNYYTPTFGNTYKYIYSDASLGIINAYTNYYYRLKWKILQ